MKRLAKLLLCMVLAIGLVYTPVTLPLLEKTSVVSVAEAATVKISKKSATVNVGATLKLKMNGTKKKVTWSTSKKSIATVSKAGVVTGKKAGKVTITAKVGGKKYNCKVTVKEAPKLNKKTATVYVGKKVTLKVKGTAKKVTWTTSDKGIATVSKKGVVTAKKAGKATITAKVGTKKLTCKVTVKSNVQPKPPVISKPWDNVEVVIPETIGEQSTPENRMKIIKYEFYEGYSSEYKMKVTFELVEYGSKGRSNWGEDFFCYDKNGNLLTDCWLYAGSLALGRTFTYTAYIPSETAKIVFEEYPAIIESPEDDTSEPETPVTPEPETPVTPAPETPVSPEPEPSVPAVIPVKEVVLNKSVETIYLGETLHLFATVNPSDATDKTVTWTSKDESIAIVDENGKVVSVGVGSTVIYAKAGEKTDSCSVTVKAPKVESVTLNTKHVELFVGETFTLVPTINPSNAGEQDVSWLVGSSAYFSFDEETGKITALHEGSSIITAMAGGKADSCTVTVKPNTYKIGEVWEVAGEWRFRIDSVEKHYECDKWNYKNNGSPVVIVKYTYWCDGTPNSNYGLIFDVGEVDVYDSNGIEGEPYYCTHVDEPIRLPFAGSTYSAGRAFQMKTDGNKFIVRVRQTPSGDVERSAMFELEI